MAQRSISAIPVVATIALLVLALSLSACQSKGLTLEGLRDRYENLGELVGHAEHCGLSTNRAEIMGALKKHASRQGANDLEQESLVSYFNASVEQKARTDSASCNADEKTRTGALLNDQLNQFK
jgi:hypothetical protein